MDSEDRVKCSGFNESGCGASDATVESDLTAVMLVLAQRRSMRHTYMKDDDVLAAHVPGNRFLVHLLKCLLTHH